MYSKKKGHRPGINSIPSSSLSSCFLLEIMKISNAEVGDSVFLACGKKNEVENILSLAREKIANELKLIDQRRLFLLY